MEDNYTETNLFECELRKTLYLDCVYVIDATADMKPYMDRIKESACVFHKRAIEIINSTYNYITVKTRVKAVWFRDFYYDGEYAYGESKFFELPEEEENFHDFIVGIHAAGGGDEPESALEALTLAMRSDFSQGGWSRRHIIVLFTNAEAHAFEDYDRLVEEAAQKGCKPEMYPENMPKDIYEFYNAWQGNSMNQDALGSEGESTKLDPSGRRLVLFAPNGYPWTDMEVELEYTIRPFSCLYGDFYDYLSVLDEGFFFD